MLTRVMTIVLNERTTHAVKVQEILTKFGCIIKARLGVSENGCSEKGLIILQLVGDSTEMDNLKNELSAFNDIIVKQMDVE